jgi:hypothetical protein
MIRIMGKDKVLEHVGTGEFGRRILSPSKEVDSPPLERMILRLDGLATLLSRETAGEP